jgi:hypothetical protein
VLLNEVFHLVAGNYAADPTNDPLWTYYCFHQKKQPDCKVICPCSCCPPVPFPRCPPPHTEVEQLANTLLNDAHSLAAANGLTPAQQTDAQELLSKAQWLYDAIVNAHCPQSAVQLAQEMDNNATALHAQLHAGTPAETLAQSVVNDADALLNKVAGIACPQDAVTLAHEALTDAQSYLTHLQNINAPANQVSDAQTLVNNAQAFYNAQKTLAAAQAASANAAASGCHPCDTWTYANYQKLLQQIIARGGWSRHVADRKKDVPKDACYVSHQCGIYVWVDQSNVTDLRDLTLVVLDIASADLNSLNQGDTHSSSQKKQSLQAHAAKLRVDSMRAQLQALRYTAQRAAERDTTQRQVFSNRIDNLNSEAASLDSLAATLDALAAAEPITVSPTPSRAPRLGPGFPFPAPPAPPTVSP